MGKLIVAQPRSNTYLKREDTKQHKKENKTFEGTNSENGRELSGGGLREEQQISLQITTHFSSPFAFSSGKRSPLVLRTWNHKASRMIYVHEP
ncbi:hypothetical protein L596_001550 [Steinernema carpocapsae]|uniref:Uncharacterized protein n=1 Tax=Steinernema carpocapsae TaxID=34508 RepID=A0A4U8UMK6_STECR|nr:hypothetical protein L596_001550 [Steinernema carpocapsae]